MNDYILLILGWTIYFGLHSILAVTTIKQKIEERWKGFYKYYRLIYVILSSVGLLALFFFNASIPSQNFFPSAEGVRYVSLMLSTFGIIIIRVSFRSYSLAGFIGIKSDQHTPLIKEGILGKIRHPIYAGTLLVVIGFFLFNPDLPTLVSCACIFLYVPIGIYLEEKKLEEKYGDEYREYKRQVPPILPKLF